MSGISIVYVTHRHDPAFGWFADGLARQLGDDDVEVVLVDGRPSPERAAGFEQSVGGRFDFVYTGAKPTVFNGAHRRVRVDMHAASNARNTGIVRASRPYVVFVDDCSVPMPGWWQEVREAGRHHYVVAGAYQKRWEMEVVNGQLVASRLEATGVDVRWSRGDDGRVVPIPGSQLFGCSVGAPRALLLEVDGYDELCDGTGGEDYHLGLRLANAGVPMFYSRRMLTIESEDHHRGEHQQLVRVDPECSEDRYRAVLAAHGVGRRSTVGRHDASHCAIDLVVGLRATVSLGNHTPLARLPAADLESTAARLPATFWFDGRPFGEL